MNKIEIAKKALGLTAQLGAGAIVQQIVQNNVRPISPIHKVTIPVGSFVLGGLIARAAKEEASKQVDDVVDAWKSFTEKP